MNFFNPESLILLSQTGNRVNFLLRKAVILGLEDSHILQMIITKFHTLLNDAGVYFKLKIINGNRPRRST